jgi:hypothetical protein
MNRYTLPVAVLLALCPAVASAQVRLGISIGLPVAPRFEVIAPGIQVVAGFEEEVFLSGGWYWCRRPDGWYRSRNGRARFEYVEGRRVPRGLVRMPEGRYRNWHREGRDDRGRGHMDRERGRDDRGERRGERERGGEREHGHH